MNYAGKVSEKTIPITVNLDSIIAKNILSGEVISGESGLLTGSAGIMLLVIVLIVINIGWFVYMKKNKK